MLASHFTYCMGSGSSRPIARRSAAVCWPDTSGLWARTVVGPPGARCMIANAPPETSSSSGTAWRTRRAAYLTPVSGLRPAPHLVQGAREGVGTEAPEARAVGVERLRPVEE